MTMGYLEIHYEPECTDSVLTCIGLGYGKFLSDLAFTADSDYKQDDDYPETLFHERMSYLLEDLAEDYLEMPLLFSVELPAPMANLLGCLFRYTFLVMDREHFRQVCRPVEQGLPCSTKEAPRYLTEGHNSAGNYGQKVWKSRLVKGFSETTDRL